MKRLLARIKQGVSTSIILRELKQGSAKILGIIVLMSIGTATVIHADKILVMEEGKIVEIGAPQDLLATQGRFYDLYQAQRLDIPSIQSSYSPL